ELSSCTAVTFNTTTVAVQWTSQSETDLMGYYVYRGTSPDVDSAIRINDRMVAATNTSTTQSYSVQDTELTPETTYFYWLESVNLDASNEFFGPVTVHFGYNNNDTPNLELPTFTTLFAAYPNPFNPSTTLSFRMEKGGVANLNVYNVRGELIKHIFNGAIAAGTWRWTWDGTDMRGNSVASGVYYYRFDAGNCHKTNKMVLMK
ncbi:MAG TPA: FlgD immunoglobulin-like domain containing protein, partial [Candidatus Cloacimonadota bacterium]|nr:FlgD immunoglobulin-like domain containing protein [Candidatus Cloacimonadota bacterium]